MNRKWILSWGRWGRWSVGREFPWIRNSNFKLLPLVFMLWFEYLLRAIEIKDGGCFHNNHLAVLQEKVDWDCLQEIEKCSLLISFLNDTLCSINFPVPVTMSHFFPYEKKTYLLLTSYSKNFLKGEIDLFFGEYLVVKTLTCFLLTEIWKGSQYWNEACPSCPEMKKGTSLWPQAKHCVAREFKVL